jgi:hypothetical protein
MTLYRVGHKSQVLYNSYTLNELQRAETNNGIYTRVTVGSRLVFQNLNDKAVAFRSLH